MRLGSRSLRPFLRLRCISRNGRRIKNINRSLCYVQQQKWKNIFIRWSQNEPPHSALDAEFGRVDWVAVAALVTEFRHFRDGGQGYLGGRGRFGTARAGTVDRQIPLALQRGQFGRTGSHLRRFPVQTTIITWQCSVSIVERFDLIQRDHF